MILGFIRSCGYFSAAIGFLGSLFRDCPPIMGFSTPKLSVHLPAVAAEPASSFRLSAVHPVLSGREQGSIFHPSAAHLAWKAQVRASSLRLLVAEVRASNSS